MADPGMEEEDIKPDLSTMATAAEKHSADNECAEALLALAHSSGPTALHSDGSLAFDSLLNANYLDADMSDITVKTETKPILKYQLESLPKGGKKRGSPKADMTHLSAVCTEELRVELTKRIKLDHNYASSSNDKTYVSDNRFHGSNTTEFPVHPNANRNYFDEPKVEFKGNQKAAHGRKGAVEKNTKFKGAPKPSKSKESILSRNKNVYGVDDEHPGSSGGRAQVFHATDFSRVKSEKENLGNNLNCLNGIDLYEPDDSKYKNFNLLLKCLTTEDAFDDKSSSRERCDSNVSNANDVSFSSEEGPVLPDTNHYPEDPNDYQCRSCSKIFQKKRYLTKHIRRMHPEKQYGESEKDDLVSCPNCGHSVPRKHFKKHSNVCNAHTKKSKKQLEMDLANCQFCGIRMRRHILVKHLAQEHCVENCRDFPGFSGDLDSDSDESTISGSEHDVDDVELASPTKDLGDVESAEGFSSRSSELALKPNFLRNGQSQKGLVSCQLCNVELTEVQLSKHLAEEHCVEPPSEVKDAEKHSLCESDHSSEKCSHSMLQRFLSDSSDGGEHDVTTSNASSEECKSCVERLVSHQGDENACTTARASCTIFVGKEQNEEVKVVPQSNGLVPTHSHIAL